MLLIEHLSEAMARRYMPREQLATPYGDAVTRTYGFGKAAVWMRSGRIERKLSVFSRFFRPDPRQRQMDALHTRVVAASRDPALYLIAQVPDTVEGRFECLALHAILLLRRLRTMGEAGEAAAQEYVDCVFRHLDIELRELGVGDLSVGKRIKKLAKSFYARVAAYDAALSKAAPDNAELEAELARNVLGGEGDASELAGYARAAVAHLDTLDLTEVLNGKELFPALTQGVLNAGDPHAAA